MRAAFLRGLRRTISTALMILVGTSKRERRENVPHTTDEILFIVAGVAVTAAASLLAISVVKFVMTLF